jgi:hypothetical protein
MSIRRKIRDIYRSVLVQYAHFKSFFGVGSFPDFIIIGAQKGGTTSLYHYLIQHPQILGSHIKELQFFSTHYNRGVDWYKACFPANTNKNLRIKLLEKPVISGEGSPLYLFHPKSPQLISDLLPNVKLIVLLRNPVDRLISHYHHMVKIGRETLPLTEAVAQEEVRLAGELEKIQADPNYSVYTYGTFSYKARGRYIEQLERYTGYFKKEQMLILNSEYFFANPQSEYEKVLKFLGVETRILSNAKTENKGSYKKDEFGALRQELGEYFKPYNEKLYQFIGEDYGW